MGFGPAQGNLVPGLTSAAAVAITGGTLAGVTSLTMADAGNVVVNATTGTKIGTATTQKLGFWNATPVVQAGAIAADGGGAVASVASGATTVQVKLDALLVACRNAGIIAT